MFEANIENLNIQKKKKKLPRKILSCSSILLGHFLDFQEHFIAFTIFWSTQYNPVILVLNQCKDFFTDLDIPQTWIFEDVLHVTTLKVQNQFVLSEHV